MGRIAVVDYPGQRSCLFAESDLPAPLRKATFVRAMLRNARFHVPIRTGTFTSDTIVFDTGSSEMPLHVDLAVWKRITGRETTAAAATAIQGTAWGKPFTLASAPAAEPVMLDDLPLGTVTVFTNPAAPESFADWPVPTDGVLGTPIMTEIYAIGYFRSVTVALSDILGEIDADAASALRRKCAEVALPDPSQEEVKMTG